MAKFIISYLHDGFPKQSNSLLGGAPQEAETAIAALEALGNEEVAPGIYRDLREWTRANDTTGGAYAESAQYPGELVSAEPI